MDKKGQTLIIFVILIPIIITMIALVVDIGLMTYEFQRARGIIDDSIREYFTSYDTNEINKMLELNDIPTMNLKVNGNMEEMEVELNYKIDAIFGKIINFSEYEISLHRIGKKKSEKVIISNKE